MTGISTENPLYRRLYVTVNTSLENLCLNSSKASWSPGRDALKSILQQRQFTDLKGNADEVGDLKSIVLHDMKVSNVVSSFPVALGATITGVDNTTFNSNGDAFGMVLSANAHSPHPQQLQKDNVSLAYEFSRKFPGVNCFSTQPFT
jgi:hypothetical protein